MFGVGWGGGQRQCWDEVAGVFSSHEREDVDVDVCKRCVTVSSSDTETRLPVRSISPMDILSHGELQKMTANSISFRNFFFFFFARGQDNEMSKNQGKTVIITQRQNTNFECILEWD